MMYFPSTSVLILALAAFTASLNLSLLLLASWPSSTAAAGGEGSTPRGVHPDLVHHYRDRNTFYCLDGQGSVPWNQVNDDYCDCEDGSDEPGTSACSKGSFFCANIGHVPNVLQSSRVNDGICDCCDGSDEWWGAESKCQNNCMALGEAARVEALRKAEIARVGFARRQERSKEGKTLKEQHRRDVETINVKLETAKTLLDEREAEKLAAEVLEKEALDAWNAVKEEARKAREEAERVEEERKAMEVFRQLDTDKDGILTKEEFMSSSVFDQNEDGAVTEEEASFYMSGSDSFNEADFFSSGWPIVKPAFEPKPDIEAAEEGQSEDFDSPDVVEGKYEDEDEEEVEDDYSDYPDDVEVARPPRPPPTPVESDQVDYDDETKRLVEAAEAVRSAYEDINREVRDMERERDDLQKSIDTDFGADEEYSTLSGQCLEYHDSDYVYKVCPFDYCSQKPRSGGETRLGNWDTWILDADGQKVGMSYTRGVQCWNGPQRSTKVFMVCGTEDRLISATEPSKCEYEMTLETPGACKDPSLLAHPLHDEL